MAPRAIWKGAVGFGMVVIPIRLYPATQSKDIAFSMLHSTCHSRIRQKRFCSYHEVEVPQDEIIKGYQFAKDEFVVMEPSDFDDLPVPSKHTIEITRFVDLAAIRPHVLRTWGCAGARAGGPEAVLPAEAGAGDDEAGGDRQGCRSGRRSTCAA